jgi:hypothetical protein
MEGEKESTPSSMHFKTSKRPGSITPRHTSGKSGMNPLDLPLSNEHPCCRIQMVDFYTASKNAKTFDELVKSVPEQNNERLFLDYYKGKTITSS